MFGQFSLPIQRSVPMAAVAAAVACTLLSAPSAVAQEDQPPHRAKPPKWNRDVIDAFFDDARQHLLGQRPTRPVAAAAVGPDAPTTDAPTPDAPTAADAADGVRWSRLVDGDTLTAEVKRIGKSLASPLANPSKFKAGGYQRCRYEFSVLALLFAVIAEHDQQVRWHDQAAALRDAFARTADNCKVGADQSYVEATRRKTELDDLIRGQRVALSDQEQREHWHLVADRSQLMQRMEAALEERISPALASAATFKQQSEVVRHEAQLLAVLAEVMRRENYEYWDDDNFVEMALNLRRAAEQISQSAVQRNYDQARQAVGNASKSCSNCHEGYRG